MTSISCAFSWDTDQTVEVGYGEKAAVLSKDITNTLRDFLSAIHAKACLLAFMLKTSVPLKDIQCLLFVPSPDVFKDK